MNAGHNKLRTDILVIGRLDTGLKRVRGLLVLLRGGNEQALAQIIVRVSSMLVCLGKNREDCLSRKP